jgi:hypothetical protein
VSIQIETTNPTKTQAEFDKNIAELWKQDRERIAQLHSALEKAVVALKLILPRMRIYSDPAPQIVANALAQCEAILRKEKK